jgi:hypothetical protein
LGMAGAHPAGFLHPPEATYRRLKVGEELDL